MEFLGSLFGTFTSTSSRLFVQVAAIDSFRVADHPPADTELALVL